MALDLSSAPAAPPRSSRAAKAQTAKTTGKTAQREEAANGVFQLLGFGCIVTRQYADAGAINLHGAPIAHELALLADKNESIGKGLDYIMDAGPYAGVIVAAMPLVLQVMANHGLIRADLVAGGGVVPPEALASQVRADMARQAAEALRAQQAAEQELHTLAEAMRPQDGSGDLSGGNGQSPPPSRSARGKTRAGEVPAS